MGIEIATGSNLLYKGNPITDYSLGLKFTGNELNSSNKQYFNRTYYSQTPNPTLVGYNDIEDPYFINSRDLAYTNPQGSTLSFKAVDTNWGNEPAEFNSSYKIDGYDFTAASLRSTPIPALYGVDSRLKKIHIINILNDKVYKIEKKNGSYIIYGTDLTERIINKNFILEIQAPGGNGGVGIQHETASNYVYGGGGAAGGYMLLAIDMDNIIGNNIQIATYTDGVRVYYNKTSGSICFVGRGGNGGETRLPGAVVSIGYTQAGTYISMTNDLTRPTSQGMYGELKSDNYVFDVKVSGNIYTTGGNTYLIQETDSFKYGYGSRGTVEFYNAQGSTNIYSTLGQRGIKGKCGSSYNGTRISKGTYGDSYKLSYSYPIGDDQTATSTLNEAIYLINNNDKIDSFEINSNNRYDIDFFSDKLSNSFSYTKKNPAITSSAGGIAVLDTGNGGTGIAKWYAYDDLSDSEKKTIQGGSGEINIYYYEP